jgi:hypothetical protein
MLIAPDSIDHRLSPSSQEALLGTVILEYKLHKCKDCFVHLPSGTELRYIGDSQ